MLMHYSLHRLSAWLSPLLCALSVGAGEMAADGLIASPEKGWPQWRGARRDGISSETGLRQNWGPEGPRVLWKCGGLGRGWSAPIIVGDSIFITGDIAGELNIFCLDLQGKIKWKATNGAAWLNPYPGARASCAYSEGTLYHANAYGRVAAFDPSTGRELWNVNILKLFEGQKNIWGISECLLIDGPCVIVTPVGAKALMAALNKKTGEVVWSTEPIPGDKAAYTSPILFRMGNQRIISNCSAGHGFGVDAGTGKLLWKVLNANPYGATCCSPVFGDGSVFYAVPMGPPSTKYSLKQVNDTVSAEILWKTPVDPLTGGGIFKDGVLYANGCKKSKALHCLDWNSGASRYESLLSSESAGNATGAMLWADGRLYCLFENGVAAMLKPAADKFEVAGKFQFVDSGKAQDAWAHPVILDGRLYLRYHDSLWCYDERNN